VTGSLLGSLPSMRHLLASKHHCSPDLHRVGGDFLDEVERLEGAFRQACMNLATIRPSGQDTSLGQDAESWQRALYQGLGSPW
jgi:hypothetical protein